MCSTALWFVSIGDRSWQTWIRPIAPWFGDLRSYGDIDRIWRDLKRGSCNNTVKGLLRSPCGCTEFHKSYFVDMNILCPSTANLLRRGSLTSWLNISLLFTSLYPFVMYAREYPKGKPTIMISTAILVLPKWPFYHHRTCFIPSFLTELTTVVSSVPIVWGS